jgi:Ca-activated chloride channel family protein
MAADRGVKVYTVGFGPRRGVHRFRRLVGVRSPGRGDAQSDRGNDAREYFHAGTAADLKKVYQSLNARLVLERKETEITFLFAAVAAALFLAASLLSLLWFNRTV